MSNTSVEWIAGSYKDPAGFVFIQGDNIYRQVNKSYAKTYDVICKDGFYEKLWQEKFLIPHVEVVDVVADSTFHYKTLKAEKIPFVTYPYEWSFLMFQKAALFTLDLQIFCVKNGYSLKDATPFNVQFIGTNPIWIDTLSFEKLDATKPWIGYQQFLQTQVYPLLIHESNPHLKFDILLQNLNGVNAFNTSSLIKSSKKWSISYWMYVYLMKKMGNTSTNKQNQNIQFSQQKQLNILQHLKSFIQSFKAPSLKISWKNYYQDHIEHVDYSDKKWNVLKEFIPQGNTNKFALDLGANTGKYSELLHEKGYYVLSSDFDINCIDEYFRQTEKKQSQNIQIFLFDVAHPSPAIGFGNEERYSITQRLQNKIQLTIALAFIHHLRVTYNIPLQKVAAYLASITKDLVIEFVPPTDSKYIALTAHRKDVFEDYTEENFEKQFSLYFQLKQKTVLAPSQRILYLFKNNL